jgi:hypothetical protein
MGENYARRTLLLAAAALLLFVPAAAQLGKKMETTGQLRPNPSPRRARFRVTLNGFFVNRQTVDHALQVDGKGDEVYCVADVLLYNRAGELLLRRRRQSAVLGDTAGFPQRLRAGSAGDSGGLKSGDAYPHAEPWRRRADTLLRDEVGARAGLPMVLWEGELAEGESLVQITPTIWEWDGNPELFGQWNQELERSLRQRRGDLGALIDAIRTPVLSQPTYGRSDVVRTRAGFDFRLNVGTAGDRPIGLAPIEAQTDEFYSAQLTLTYAAALEASRGGRAVEVIYREPLPSHLEGDYTLYLQIERLP